MGRIREPPKRVKFEYLGETRTGMMAKATDIERIESDRGDYAARIELIEWDDGKKAVRFGYYHRKRGKKGDDDWNWVRNAWTFSVDRTRRQIEQAKSIGFFD